MKINQKTVSFFCFALVCSVSATHAQLNIPKAKQDSIKHLFIDTTLTRIAPKDLSKPALSGSFLVRYKNSYYVVNSKEQMAQYLGVPLNKFRVATYSGRYTSEQVQKLTQGKVKNVYGLLAFYEKPL